MDIHLTERPSSKIEGKSKEKLQPLKQASISTPLVSLITIVHNGKKHLEQTIQSVLDQTYPNIEYIIIDGGSTDGTVELIEKYEDRLAYWVSEPDNGISNAFNKGIRQAKGGLIGIINADDWYEQDAIENVVAHYDKAAIFYGKLNYWTVDNQCIIKENDHTKLAKNITSRTISHPTVFVKRKVYEKIGLFNENFKIAMDYEFLLRAYQSGISFYNVNEVLANFRAGGVSGQSLVPAIREEYLAKKRMLNQNVIKNYCSFLIKSCLSLFLIKFLKINSFEFLKRIV